jgi:hypothetical protein
VINSVPVFIDNQERWVMGSEWDFSTGETNVG